MSFDGTIKRIQQQTENGRIALPPYDDFHDQITVNRTASHPSLARINELFLASHFVDQHITYQSDLLTGFKDHNRRFGTCTTPLSLEEAVAYYQPTVESAILVFKSIRFNQ